MRDYPPTTCLLASHDPVLLTAMEPVLLTGGYHVQVVLSAQDALSCCSGPNPPELVLLDSALPGTEPNLGIARLLASLRVLENCRAMPIVLISDTITPEWSARLDEGVLDDLIPRAADPVYWRVRIDLLRRANRLAQEVDTLREAALHHAQLDRLTGAYNRETLLAMLLRETDRAQRMNSALCLILFDIDDFGHWNARLGAQACDELLCQVAGRSTRLLRSYDLLGRPGKDEFLAALPGCSTVDALMLAERLRMDVFAAPYRIGGDSIRLSACFGIATSHGRSPVIVLREAEQALEYAKSEGPETIHCYDGSQSPARAPVTFVSPTSGDELLAW